jgi:hypothetical protein
MRRKVPEVLMRAKLYKRAEDWERKTSEDPWELTNHVDICGSWSNFWCSPPTLNHEGCRVGSYVHPDIDTPFFRGEWSYMKKNRWMHVAFAYHTDDLPYSDEVFGTEDFIS